MKDNIKEKNIVTKLNIIHMTSKNDIDTFQPNSNSNIKNNIKFLTKKREFFKTQRILSLNKKKLNNGIFKDGRWKEEEKNQFILGIALYGNNWRKVNSLIKTRSTIQVRSHAQKFFKKFKLCKDDNLGIDFTLDSINNINDMINQIKSINPNFDIINIFKMLSYKSNIKFKFKKSKQNKLLINKENKAYNLSINEVQKVLIHSGKENENHSLNNNQVIDYYNNQNDLQLNEQNNLNNVFPQNNIYSFKLNNNDYMNNNLININNNSISQIILNKSFHLNTNTNLPVNDIAFNNINNDLLIDYSSTNFNNFSFISNLKLLHKQIQMINLLLENRINLINILNSLKFLIMIISLIIKYILE
jgi:SHAQKYF class myb-like DNA-binding protein